MKKILGIFLLIFLILACGLGASYKIAKGKAKKVVETFPGQLSPLNAQLALFNSSSFPPCWIFRAEYENLMTGATFDVYVSLSGRIIMIPPKAKYPE